MVKWLCLAPKESTVLDDASTLELPREPTRVHSDRHWTVHQGSRQSVAVGSHRSEAFDVGEGLLDCASLACSLVVVGRLVFLGCNAVGNHPFQRVGHLASSASLVLRLAQVFAVYQHLFAQHCQGLSCLQELAGFNRLYR